VRVVPAGVGFLLSLSTTVGSLGVQEASAPLAENILGMSACLTSPEVPSPGRVALAVEEAVALEVEATVAVAVEAEALEVEAAADRRFWASEPASMNVAAAAFSIRPGRVLTMLLSMPGATLLLPSMPLA